MARRMRGELEAQVLRVLWTSTDPLTARAVGERFPERDRPVMTTLLTILTRLEKKGLVVRTPSDSGATFAATRSESAQAASTMASALADVSDRESALVHFAGQLDDDDLRALRAALDRA